MADYKEIVGMSQQACMRFGNERQALLTFLPSLSDQLRASAQLDVFLCPVFLAVTKAGKDRKYAPAEVLEYDAQEGRWRFAVAFTVPTLDINARQVQVQLQAGCEGKTIRLKVHGDAQEYSHDTDLKAFIACLTDKVRDAFNGVALDESNNTPIRIGF